MSLTLIPSTTSPMLPESLEASLGSGVWQRVVGTAGDLRKALSPRVLQSGFLGLRVWGFRGSLVFFAESPDPLSLGLGFRMLADLELRLVVAGLGFRV